MSERDGHDGYGHDVGIATKPQRQQSYRLGPAVSRRAVAVELALDAMGDRHVEIDDLLRVADKIEKYLWAGPDSLG